MRKKIETRKKIRRICALVVVGMFVAMTPMSVSAQPNPENWSKYGDVVTDSAVLGTLNHEPLRIVTNGMERMIVTSDGKVGIGTVDPICALHVRDLTPTIPEVGTTIAIESSVSSITPGDPLGTILFMGPYEEGMWRTGAMIRAEASGPFIFENPNISPTSLQFYTQDFTSLNGLVTPRMVITAEGNVGIGTTKPMAKVHIIQDGVVDAFWVDDRANDTTPFVIDQSGNVGIGTTSPNCKLHVIGGANITGTLNITGNISSGAIYSDDVNNRVGINTTNPQYTLDVVGDVWLNSDTIKMGDGTFYNKVQKDAKLSTGNFRIIIDENNNQTDRYFSIEKDEGKNDPQGTGTELMRCQENGNVGIATIAPTEKLDVNGRVRVRDLPIDNTLTYVVAANSTGVLHRRDASTIGIQDLWKTINSDSGSTTADSPTDTLNIFGAGIASTSIVGDTLTITAIEVDGNTTNELQNLAEVYAHDGATGNAVQLTAANGDIRFYNDDATEMLFLDESSGRIGIGTTSPSQTLHVAGNVRITGALYDSNNQPGTSGQILQTTGSGTDWVDPSSISDGDWTISGNDMYSAVSGNVGIGTATPNEKLEVNGNILLSDIGTSSGKIFFGTGTGRGVIMQHPEGGYNAMVIYSVRDITGDPGDNGNLYLNTPNGTSKVIIGRDDQSGTVCIIGGSGFNDNYRLYVHGSAYATGVWASSSRDFKCNIEELSEEDYSDILEKVQKARVVTYNLKENDPLTTKKHIGIIAEEAPDEIVSDDKDAIGHSEYLGFLLAAIKAQQEEIQALKVQIGELESQITTPSP